MTATGVARSLFAAAVLSAAAFSLLDAGAARACMPEIVVDPVTGQAQGQAELEAALAELTRKVELAQAGR
ncbi:MAG TPA: hypothetical protein VGB88_00575 [Alphaproteobacteria bacterium]